MHRGLSTLAATAMLTVVLSGPAQAASTPSPSLEFGVRGGVHGTHKDENFDEEDLFVRFGLPWNWRVTGNWTITPRFEVAAGSLNAAGISGFVGSFGPQLHLTHGPAADAR